MRVCVCLRVHVRVCMRVICMRLCVRVCICACILASFTLSARTQGGGIPIKRLASFCCLQEIIIIFFFLGRQHTVTDNLTVSVRKET